MSDEFKRAEGMRYRAFLAGLHRSKLFDWYMEVGCRTGSIVELVRGKTIAVDPFFRLQRMQLAQNLRYMFFSKPVTTFSQKIF